MRVKSCLPKAVCLAHLYKVYQFDVLTITQCNIIEPGPRAANVCRNVNSRHTDACSVAVFAVLAVHQRMSQTGTLTAVSH